MLRIDYHGVEIAITVSIGIPKSGNEDGKANEILNYADEALYQAKEEGRNKIVIYQA